MKKRFSDLPSWLFELSEISTGAYEVVGKDGHGHCVSAKGTDLDKLIEMCKVEAEILNK